MSFFKDISCSSLILTFLLCNMVYCSPSASLKLIYFLLEHISERLYSLPSDLSTFKALADDILSMTKKSKFISGIVENIEEKKKKMLVINIFSFFLAMFEICLFHRVVKTSGLCIDFNGLK